MTWWRTAGVAVVAAAMCASVDAQVAAPWQWRCTGKPIEPCVRRHGRLSSQNGIALRIWLIGTNRMVAVSDTERPAEIEEYLMITGPDHSYVYGDFDVCPLEADRPGHIRLACVAGAERLVVKNLKVDRPPFRLLPTWR